MDQTVTSSTADCLRATLRRLEEDLHGRGLEVHESDDPNLGFQLSVLYPQSRAGRLVMVSAEFDASSRVVFRSPLDGNLGTSENLCAAGQRIARIARPRM